MIAEGDKVAAEATSHVAIQGGATYQNAYHFVFEFQDGRIARVKEYNDTKHAADTFFS